MKHDTSRSLLAALDAAAGAALVLDEDLCVVGASPSALRLLGPGVHAGVSAPALLCGDRPKKPIADALAAGRGIRATVPCPGDERRLVDVRSVPLGGQGRAKPLSWLLLLADAGEANDGVVTFHGMTTANTAMKQLFRMIERVADGDITVLVRGESGTGKELVANALHAVSRRSKGPFQAINCAALPATLLEAELFGTLRGAFTGAHKDTPGLIRSAHKGTLFLDEVAEIPLELQAKLLRVLETRLVLPVGGHEPVPVDVRVVSATHRALRKEVEAGRFRADLMYRLRVIPLFLPSLRERSADVPLLARRFVDEINQRSRRQIVTIAPAALAALQRWPWPGNVRELRNALEYAAAMGDGPVLMLSELPPEILDEVEADTAAAAPQPHGHRADRGRIEQALSDADGHREAAAAALGISRITLWRWMKDAGLAAPRTRSPAALNATTSSRRRSRRR